MTEDCDDIYDTHEEVEACEYGREVAEGVGREAAAHGEEDTYMGEPEPRASMIAFQDSFTQSARYANNVLPRLRQIAGCEDATGVGTYTDCEDARVRPEEVTHAFWRGADNQIEEEWEAYGKPNPR